MIKRLLTFLLLAYCSTAQATIDVVTANSVSGGTASTPATQITLTLPSTPATDSRVHYVAIALAGTTGIPYLSSATADAYAPTAWVRANGQASVSTASVLYLLKARATPTATLVLNFAPLSATASFAAIACEIISDYPLVLDRYSYAVATDSTTCSTGTSSATSMANEIALAALAHRWSTSTATPGSFTSITNSFSQVVTGGHSTTNAGSSNDREADLLYKILSSTGTVNAGATVTDNGTSDNIGQVITLYEARPGSQTADIYGR